MSIVLEDEKSPDYKDILIDIDIIVGFIDIKWNPIIIRKLLGFFAHNDILNDKVQKDIGRTSEDILEINNQTTAPNDHQQEDGKRKEKPSLLCCSEFKYTYIRVSTALREINIILIQPILNLSLFELNIKEGNIIADMFIDHFIISGKLDIFNIRELSNYPYTIRSQKDYKESNKKAMLNTNNKNSLIFNFKSRNKVCKEYDPKENITSETNLTIKNVTLNFYQESFMRFFNYLISEFLGSLGPSQQVIKYRTEQDKKLMHRKTQILTTLNVIKNQDKEDNDDIIIQYKTNKSQAKSYKYGFNSFHETNQFLIKEKFYNDEFNKKIEFMKLNIVIENPKLILRARPGFKEFFEMNLKTLRISCGYRKRLGVIRNLPNLIRIISIYKLDIEDFSIKTHDNFYICEPTNTIVNMHFKMLSENDLKCSDLLVDKSFRFDVLVNPIKIRLRQNDFKNIMMLNDLNISYLDGCGEDYDYAKFYKEMNEKEQEAFDSDDNSKNSSVRNDYKVDFYDIEINEGRNNIKKKVKKSSLMNNYLNSANNNPNARNNLLSTNHNHNMSKSNSNLFESQASYQAYSRSNYELTNSQINLENNHADFVNSISDNSIKLKEKNLNDINNINNNTTTNVNVKSNFYFNVNKDNNEQNKADKKIENNLENNSNSSKYSDPNLYKAHDFVQKDKLLDSNHSSLHSEKDEEDLKEEYFDMKLNLLIDKIEINLLIQNSSKGYFNNFARMSLDRLYMKFDRRLNSNKYMQLFLNEITIIEKTDENFINYYNPQNDLEMFISSKLPNSKNSKVFLVFNNQLKTKEIDDLKNSIKKEIKLEKSRVTNFDFILNKNDLDSFHAKKSKIKTFEDFYCDLNFDDLTLNILENNNNINKKIRKNLKNIFQDIIFSNNSNNYTFNNHNAQKPKINVDVLNNNMNNVNDVYNQESGNSNVKNQLDSPDMRQHKSMKSFYSLTSRKSGSRKKLNLNFFNNIKQKGKENIQKLKNKFLTEDKIIENKKKTIKEYDRLKRNLLTFNKDDYSLKVFETCELNLLIKIDAERGKFYRIYLNNLKVLVKIDTFMLIKQFFVEGFPYYSTNDKDLPNLYEDNEEKNPGMFLDLIIENPKLALLTEGLDNMDQDVICLASNINVEMDMRKILDVKKKIFEKFINHKKEQLKDFNPHLNNDSSNINNLKVNQNQNSSILNVKLNDLNGSNRVDLSNNNINNNLSKEIPIEVFQSVETVENKKSNNFLDNEATQGSEGGYKAFEGFTENIYEMTVKCTKICPFIIKLTQFKNPLNSEEQKSKRKIIEEFDFLFTSNSLLKLEEEKHFFDLTNFSEISLIDSDFLLKSSYRDLVLFLKAYEFNSNLMGKTYEEQLNSLKAYTNQKLKNINSKELKKKKFTTMIDGEQCIKFIQRKIREDRNLLNRSLHNEDLNKFYEQNNELFNKFHNGNKTIKENSFITDKEDSLENYNSEDQDEKKDFQKDANNLTFEEAFNNDEEDYEIENNNLENSEDNNSKLLSQEKNTSAYINNNFKDFKERNRIATSKAKMQSLIDKQPNVSTPAAYLNYDSFNKDYKNNNNIQGQEVDENIIEFKKDKDASQALRRASQGRNKDGRKVSLLDEYFKVNEATKRARARKSIINRNTIHDLKNELNVNLDDKRFFEVFKTNKILDAFNIELIDISAIISSEEDKNKKQNKHSADNLYLSTDEKKVLLDIQKIDDLDFSKLVIFNNNKSVMNIRIKKVEIIIIDDHANHYYPFFYMNFNNINIDNSNLDLRHSSQLINVEMKFKTYNYIANLWEPLLEPTYLCVIRANTKEVKESYCTEHSEIFLTFKKDYSLIKIDFNISDLTVII